MRHLGGDEHIFAPHARGVQPLAHLLLVAVDQRAVEMTIAEFQRLLGDARADASVELPGAETDRWNFCAVGVHGLHHAPHTSHFGACGGLTTRPSGFFRVAISLISAGLSEKSSISRFSFCRSGLPEPGMTMMPCCTSQRSETWLAVLRCASPTRSSTGLPGTRPRAIGQ